MNKWLGLALAALLLTSGCEKIEAEVDKLRNEDEESGLKVKLVRTYQVQENQEGLYQEVSGIVQPQKERSLSFGTSGRIARIFVQKGSVVKAGSLLATLDSSVWQQQMTAAQGQVASANARRNKTLQGADEHEIGQQRLEMEKARQTAARAADEYAKGKVLYAHGAIAKEELDNLALKNTQAKIEWQEEQLSYKKLMEGADKVDMQVADAEVQQAQAEIQRAQSEANEAALKAPFTGVVAQISRKEAEQTDSGDEVIRLVDVSQWLVQLQVESDQIGNWQKGKKVKLRSPDGTQAEGVVSFVAPVIDEKTGTYPVEVAVQGAMTTWRGGMTVTCQYEVKANGGLLIPVTSVGISEETYYVMKINDNTIKKEPVKLGALYGQYYEVLEGLKPGDQIVETGISYVVDGEAVKVANEE